MEDEHVLQDGAKLQDGEELHLTVAPCVMSLLLLLSLLLLCLVMYAGNAECVDDVSE